MKIEKIGAFGLIVRHDKNFYTSGWGINFLRRLKELGVNQVITIGVVNDAEKAFCRRNNISLYDLHNRLNSDWPSTNLHKTMAGLGRAYVLNGKKVAACCANGNYSNQYVGPHYQKLKRGAGLSKSQSVANTKLKIWVRTRMRK